MARVTLTVQLMHAQQRIAVLERELHEANERCAQLEAAQQPSRQATQQLGRKPQPAECANYWDYVAACRAWCREHNRPVSYLSRDDYLMARQEAAHA